MNATSLYANPRLVLDPEQAALKLSRALPDINVEAIERNCVPTAVSYGCAAILPRVSNVRSTGWVSRR